MTTETDRHDPPDAGNGRPPVTVFGAGIATPVATAEHEMAGPQPELLAEPEPEVSEPEPAAAEPEPEVSEPEPEAAEPEAAEAVLVAEPEPEPEAAQPEPEAAEPEAAEPVLVAETELDADAVADEHPAEDPPAVPVVHERAPSALRPSAPRPVVLSIDDETAPRRFRASAILVVTILASATGAALVVGLAVAGIVLGLRRIAG